MLVYANFLDLDPPDGIDSVISLYSEWVSGKNHSLVDQGMLADGIQNLRLSRDAVISSFATVDGEGAPVYPYFYHSSFSHPDYNVDGRRWVTEIGLRQFSRDDQVCCSFALFTHESSTKAFQKFRVTRPHIVRNIAEKCRPADNTLGQQNCPMDENSVSKFVTSEVLADNRDHPLVLLGPSVSEALGLTFKDVKSVVIGLARVVTFKSEEAAQNFASHISPNYSVSKDTIRIIPPIRYSSYEEHPRTSVIRGFRKDGAKKERTFIFSDILSEVTSYTNESKYKLHITAEKVKEEKRNIKLREISKVLKSTVKKAENIPAYEELLEEASQDLQTYKEDNEALSKSLQAAHASLDKAEAALQAADLAKPGSSSADLVDAIRDLCNGKVKLEQALMLATSLLHPTRFTVLDSAHESARESDRGGFRHGAKALKMLIQLGEKYWETLVNGGGDQQAKAVFGKSAFAPKEKDMLRREGRKRRTFIHKGNKIFMERHLKLGAKDSLAETLRVHFHWDEEEKRIVIGHCGKHLDF